MILKSAASPVGEVNEFFYKVEFQLRGSPHIHMLAWVKNAPQLDGSQKGEKFVLQFVEAHSTCTRDTSLGDLVSLQEHNQQNMQKKDQKCMPV